VSEGQHKLRARLFQMRCIGHGRTLAWQRCTASARRGLASASATFRTEAHGAKCEERRTYARYRRGCAMQIRVLCFEIIVNNGLVMRRE
jgi:hypothetical protein